MPTAPDNATVRARVPPPTSLRAQRFHERVGTSLWFVPALFVVGAFLASRGLTWLDQTHPVQRHSGLLLGIDPSDSAVVTSTVATAMLTFIAVVFSTTLVAVQVAASQYSPRIVRLFVRARVVHVTLGVFLATFVFSLDALVVSHTSGRGYVPVRTLAATYLLVAATLFMFVLFVHSMVRMLRVQYLLSTVTALTRPVLRLEFPEDGAYAPVPLPASSPRALLRCPAGTAGVVQAMDLAALASLAAAHDCWIDVLVKVGQYLGEGSPLAEIHGPGVSEMDAAHLLHHILIGGERTFLQDAGFGVRQLTDTANRALSPAINDPTTASQAIDRITDLLASIAGAPDPSGWYVDDDGTARVRRHDPTFDDLCQLGFTEVIHYGADAPQVIRRLLASLDLLEDLASEQHVDGLRALRRMTADAAALAIPAPLRDVSSAPDGLGLG